MSFIRPLAGVKIYLILNGLNGYQFVNGQFVGFQLYWHFFGEIAVAVAVRA
jgi:hypothetical protein